MPFGANDEEDYTAWNVEIENGIADEYPPGSQLRETESPDDESSSIDYSGETMARKSDTSDSAGRRIRRRPWSCVSANSFTGVYF
jgi:hypothetical protein